MWDFPPTACGITPCFRRGPRPSNVGTYIVCCAFSFCWWAYLRRQATIVVDQTLKTAPALSAGAAGEKRRGRGRTPNAVVAGGVAAGAGLARPVDDALALVVRVVERAPAARFAGVT